MKYSISALLLFLSLRGVAGTCEDDLAITLTYLQPGITQAVNSAPNCSHNFYSVVTEIPFGRPHVHHKFDRMCPGWNEPIIGLRVLEYYLCDNKSSLAKKWSYGVHEPFLQCGSIVQADSQIVGESVPIVGADFRLNYFTSWSYGRVGNFKVNIDLSGPTVRTNISSFDVVISDGSNILQNISVPNTAPNYTHSYNWNGLNGAGAPVLGSFILNVVVKEHRPSVVVPIHSSVTLGGLQAVILGLGGWLPSNYVFYDAVGKRIFKGDGAEQLSAAKLLSTGEFMVTESDGSLVYFHDSSGRHLRTKLGLTGTVIEEFTYDSSGRLASIVQPFSKITTFNRDSMGHLVSVTSPNGMVTTVEIDVNGYISKITSPDSKEHTVTYYGSDGLIHTFQRPGGDISTFTFDSYGNLIKDDHSGGYFFDLVRNLQSNFTHDIKSISVMGRSTGIQTSAQDSNLSRTINYPSTMQDKYVIYDYPSSGQKNTQATKRSVVTTVNRVNDPRFSNLAKRTVSTAQQMNGQWRQINYGYNLTLSDPNDPFSINTFQIDQTVLGKNTKLTSVFNPLTKTFTHTTYLGRINTQTIDNYQRLVASKVGNETPIEYLYTDDHLTQVKQGSRTATFSYNNLRFLSSFQPLSGAPIYYGYDPDGRVISTSRDGVVTTVSYDANGNVASIQPFLRPIHAFSYNAHGLPAQYLPPPLAGVSPVATSYVYNLDKQMTQIVRPDGDNITFNYNSVTGLLSSYVTPVGSFAVNMNPTVNSPAVVTAPSGGITTEFFYYGDKVAKTRIAKTGLGSIGAYEAKYAAGTHLQNSEIVTAGFTNFTTNYTYTDDEQLATAGAMSYTYSPLEGYLYTSSLVEGAGTVADSYTYNSFGEVVAYGVWHGTNLLYSYDLTRDGAGRVQTKDQNLGGTSSAYTYTYDNLDRLVEVAVPGPNVISTYTYDSNGNRIGGNVGSQATTAVYDEQDRMKSYNVFSYAYTKNGDLLSKTNTLTSEITSYIYDVFGNLKSVTLPTAAVITYDVDALNRRVLKSVGGVVQKRWIFRDQYRIAAQLTGAGVMEKQFVYGAKKNIPDYMIYNNEKYRIVSDNLGSLRLVVKVSDGTIAQKMNHDEFGRVIEDTNPGFTPFGFAGGQYDSDTRLVRFGARDYDPETGRWTSKDPIFFKGGDTNLYGYTWNDPVNFVDPMGLWGFQIGVGAGGMLGLAGAGFSGGLAVTYSQSHGLQVGGYLSSQWNAGIGASAGRGIQASVSPNACSLQDLGGTSPVVGVDTPLFGASVSGTSANPTFGTSFGPSLGAAVYGGVSGTQVFPFFMSSPQGAH